MFTLSELAGLTPEKTQELLDMARASEAERARAAAESALSQEAAAGKKAIEAARTLESEAPEYGSKMAKATSKAAKAAEGAAGKGIISDLPQVTGKMGAAAEKAARAAAGTVGEGVIPLSGEAAAGAAKASSLSKAILGNPFLAKIAGMAASPAGKMALKGMGGAGLVAGLYGDDLAEDADAPKNVFSGDAKQLTPQQMASIAAPGKKLNYVPDSDQRTLKDEPAQVASSMPKKDEEASIVAEAMASPVRPEYLALEAEERKKLEDIQKGFERSSDMSNEDKARHYDTAAKQFTPEKIQERVEKRLAEIEDKKSELGARLADIDSRLSSETNPFRKKELLAQQAQFSSELASLGPKVVDTRKIAEEPIPVSKPSPSSELADVSAAPLAPAPSATASVAAASQKQKMSPVAASAAPAAPTAPAPAKATKPLSEGASTGDAQLDAMVQASQEESRVYSDLLKRYDEARAQQAERLRDINLREGFEMLTYGLAGAKPRDASAYYSGLRKQAESGIEQFKEREELGAQARKNDPNSAESRSYRSLLAEQGIKVPDTVTAAFVEKQYPQFANIMARREAAKDRAEDRAIRRQEFSLRREEIGKSKEDKEFVQLYDSLDPTKGRAGQFGEQYKIVAQADRLGGLIDKSKYGMNLTGPEMEELAIGTARLLAGAGGTSRSQIEALVPQSARGKISDMVGWVTNNPTGRQQQEFVKRTKALLDREKALAQDKIEATIRQRAKARGHLKTTSPRLYDEAVNSAIETFAGRKTDSKDTTTQEKVVVEKDGKQFKLPRTQLESAIKQGYKEIK